MRIQCPACEVAFQVPDDRISGAAQMRCGRCGHVFSALTAQEPPREPPADREAPPPPEVMYVTRDMLAARLALIPGGPPGSGRGPEAADPLPTPAVPRPAGGVTLTARHDVPERRMAAVTPEPPPPYVPAGERPRSPLEPLALAPMAPQPARNETPVNIRATGALGPPPPYRPIARVSQGFARGAAPDLEPWREEAMTRAAPPPDAPDSQSGWEISRDVAPLPVQEASQPAPVGVPVLWPYENEPPPPPRFGAQPPRRFALPWQKIRAPADKPVLRPIRRFPKRRVMALAGLVAGVAVLGLGLVVRRADVMRYLPAAESLYARMGFARD